jgi:hypothetical protein
MTLVTPATNSDQTGVCSFSKKTSLIESLALQFILNFQPNFVRVYFILILNHLLCLNTEPNPTFLLLIPLSCADQSYQTFSAPSELYCSLKLANL